MSNLLTTIDFELIKKLNQEKEKLLTERPQYREYQKQIDEALEKAGSRQNRMAILGTMMRDKVAELQQKMIELSTMLSINIQRNKNV